VIALKHVPTQIEARLLPVVVDLLFKHGYAGLNIREVSKVTGMGPATIYKYFGSKEKLTLRVLQDLDHQVAEVILPGIPGSGPQYDRWKAFYRSLLSYYDEYPVVAVIQNISMPTSTWFLPQDRWPVVEVAEVIRALISEGRACGELDPLVSDNQILATHYMHLVREVRLWHFRGMSWRLIDRLEIFFAIIWKTISTPGAAK